MKKDNALWTNANLTIDNGRDHYTLSPVSNGVYKANVLEYEGHPYNLTVESVIDTNTNQITKSDKNKTYDYYTVDYYNYKLTGDGLSYEVDSSKVYRQQIVRKGCYTSAPSDAYVPGLTFRWYSSTKWDNGDAYNEFSYSTTPINAKTTLDAQFAQPKVEVNEWNIFPHWKYDNFRL